jgi:hypothetical protein
MASTVTYAVYPSASRCAYHTNLSQDLTYVHDMLDEMVAELNTAFTNLDSRVTALEHP